MALLLIRYLANSLRQLLLEAGRINLNFISRRVKCKTRVKCNTEKMWLRRAILLRIWNA